LVNWHFGWEMSTYILLPMILSNLFAVFFEQKQGVFLVFVVGVDVLGHSPSATIT
jgi:hypothetical protein